jgi:hypothetical protein
MGCQACTDDPWLNLSAEEPDHDRIFSIKHYVERPPLGWEFRSTGCVRICVSTVSQEEADDCALASAKQCLYNDWDPHGPNDHPFEPPTLYTNNARTCTIRCSDGMISPPGENTFTWTVPAGTVIALSQEQADAIAQSEACQRARQHRICINDTLAGGCVNQAYKQRIIATGGTPAIFPYLGFTPPIGCLADEAAGDRFANAAIPYTFSLIDGSLPPGLELRPCTGFIKGTPTTSGTYNFTVRAVDAIGSFQERSISLSIIEITTAADLPNAVLGEEYLQSLVETGGDPFSEQWSIVAGELPPGLSMSTAGIITGTPTGALAGYQFTAQVTTLGATCQKVFHITISDLRLLAYWTLDEVAGDRLDSLGANNLSPVGTVGFDTGKISNAFKQTVAGTDRLEKSSSTSLLFDPTKGMTVAGWFYPTATGPFQGFFGWVLLDGTFSPAFDISLQKITTLDPPPARLYATICDNVLAVCYEIKLDITVFYGTWNFFRLWIDPADNKLKLQINNGTVNEIAIGFTIPEQGVSSFEIGRSGPDYRVDEIGVWEGVLSDSDATDLYNAGAGKTYPDVPGA